MFGQPKLCRSATLGPKGRAFCCISGSLSEIKGIRFGPENSPPSFQNEYNSKFVPSLSVNQVMEWRRMRMRKERKFGKFLR